MGDAIGAAVHVRWVDGFAVLVECDRWVVRVNSTVSVSAAGADDEGDWAVSWLGRLRIGFHCVAGRLRVFGGTSVAEVSERDGC